MGKRLSMSLIVALSQEKRL